MKILHVDLDAFYASVEELDHPEYKNRPLAVGGQREDGILTTANYPARKFGVHSAMPVFMAKSLCPDLIILPMHRKKYLEKSQEVFGLLQAFSPRIEKVSIDEAYLDVSHWQEEEVEKSLALKKKIKEETGLNISVGLSYNKFLAKLASDWKKPDGFFWIKEEDIPDLLFPLPISKVHGIGSRSEDRLHRMGIRTVEDLYQLDQDFLQDHFHKAGLQWYRRIRGIDPRPVEVNSRRKSLGTEETFHDPITKREDILAILKAQCQELEEESLKKGIQGATVSIKLKTKDFKVYTRSKTLREPVYRWQDTFAVCRDLMDKLALKAPLRLVGCSLNNLMDRGIEQMTFL